MRLLFLIFSSLLAVTSADSVSTYSKQVCRTALNLKQGGGETTTKASTVHLTKTIKITVTPVSTVIPKSATRLTKSTITKATTTTLPQKTSTFSSTVSFTATTTESTTLTFTSTSTSFETTTSLFDTTTIAASSGFLPLASALAAQGHAASKKHRRGVESVEHAAAEPAALEERATSQQIVCGSDGKIAFNPPQYHGSVTCYKNVQIVTTKTVTSTAKKTRTITAPRGTVTSTVYTTRTKTFTETPVQASTTLTFSTTQTVTTTLSSSYTQVVPYTTTSTVYPPQPTYYAACAANNAVSFVDNKRIFQIAVTDPDNGFSFGNSTTTPYDCCVQCVLSGTCGGSTFHPASGTCYMFPIVGTCNPTTQSGQFSVQSGSNVGFVVGNSNCGQVALL